jgi:hypothetical protein
MSTLIEYVRTWLKWIVGDNLHASGARAWLSRYIYIRAYNLFQRCQIFSPDFNWPFSVETPKLPTSSQKCRLFPMLDFKKPVQSVSFSISCLPHVVCFLWTSNKRRDGICDREKDFFWETIFHTVPVFSDSVRVSRSKVHHVPPDALNRSWKRDHWISSFWIGHHSPFEIPFPVVAATFPHFWADDFFSLWSSPPSRFLSFPESHFSLQPTQLLAI